ncbi:MAG TPA: glycosyltransferase family 39 protein [Candidatus Thermoplasmatota archaeon]|nr:glycosyltransferase family 39 protein [Candidatus Thermoplasmatota archaeon]
MTSAHEARLRTKLSRFEWGCVLVLVLAALVRATFVLAPSFIWDSAWYLMLARSFGDTGTFLIPWSDPAAPEYSGYWPPLYPIFVSPFVKLFGPSYATLVLAADVAAALLVAGVFIATRDLFDRPRAFAAAAIVAASPAFYVSDARGMSESLLGLMVALTVWAFVKSLERPIWLPVAGGFAFLAYLGKANVGLPLVGAGVLALAGWRLYTRGWRRILRSSMDVTVALVGIAAMAYLAFTRSERVGGLGLGIIDPLRYGVMQADCAHIVGIHSVGPHCWAIAFPLKIAFVALFLFVIALPLSLRLPQALKAARTERTDAIWLAVLLPLLAGAVFTTSFFFTESRTFVDFDNIRYLTPAVVPFVWALLPFWRFDDEPEAQGERVRRHHETWYWLAVGVYLVVLLFNPLTATETLGRFVALTILAGVAIVLSLFARQSQYEVAERRATAGTQRRYVRKRQPLVERRMALVAAGLLVLGGWAFTAWYAFIGYGLLIALATPSPARRVVAMSLILLMSAAPGASTAFPGEDAAQALATLPEGTIVGMSETIAYPAAVAPDNVRLKLIDPSQPIPDDVQVMAIQGAAGSASYENFTRVRDLNYKFLFTPTLAWRVEFEKNVLGGSFEYPEVLGIALYVRNGTGLERYVAP